jgi:hypothetical protein
LEGFTQPRKLVLDTLGRQFGFPIEKAGALYSAIPENRSFFGRFFSLTTAAFRVFEMLKCIPFHPTPGIVVLDKD